MIAKCDKCKHEFQDKNYGKQQRVHNITKTPGHIRCTVCGTVRMSSGTQEVVK